MKICVINAALIREILTPDACIDLTGPGGHVHSFPGPGGTTAVLGHGAAQR